MANRNHKPHHRRHVEPSKRKAYQAFARARKLGRLNAKRPAGYVGDNRFPVLTDGQVYALRAGMVFHAAPCPSVLTAFDANPKNLVVILRQSVGERRECKSCTALVGAP